MLQLSTAYSQGSIKNAFGKSIVVEHFRCSLCRISVFIYISELITSKPWSQQAQNLTSAPSTAATFDAAKPVTWKNTTSDTQAKSHTSALSKGTTFDAAKPVTWKKTQPDLAVNS